MKKVQVDPKPDRLLQIKNGYKIAAATWIIQAVMENIAEYTSHLNNGECEKVNREVDRILDKIRTKRRKDAGNG